MNATATLAAVQPDSIDRSACSATRHGDRLAYSRHRCRCPDAGEDEAQYRRQLRLNHIANGTLKPKPQKATSAIGCSRLPIGGMLEPGDVLIKHTAGRVRVLATLGYDWVSIADELPGVDVDTVRSWAYRQVAVVQRSIARQVRAAFHTLVRRPAPWGPATDDILKESIAAGWGVVDHIAVRKAMERATCHLMYWKVPLTKLERWAVVYIGDADGVGTTAVCTITGFSGEAVSEGYDPLDDPTSAAPQSSGGPNTVPSWQSLVAALPRGAGYHHPRPAEAAA
jgi:hypothetical protein